jgi:eukaryotic-like serine/threonine-protein kinase
MRRVLGPEHPYTLTAMNNLADLYQAQGRFELAESLHRQRLAAQKRVEGEQHPAVAVTLASLGLNLISQEKWTDAESSFREQAQPDLWSTFNARSLLGGSLLGQKKYAEAEPLLVSGFEEMKAREAKVPLKSKNRLPEAVGRLIQFYTAVGKANEAARWRAELKFSTKNRPDMMPAEELPSNPFAR